MYSMWKLFLHFILVLKMKFNLQASVWNSPAEHTPPAVHCSLQD